MVYVSRGGTVCENPPWSLDRIVKLFYGFIAFIVLFFKSLVGLDGNSKDYRTSKSGSSNFRGWGGGGGGGGGRPFGPGGGGGGGSGPRRFMTLRDVNPPSVGGCPGGSCGM